MEVFGEAYDPMQPAKGRGQLVTNSGNGASLPRSLICEKPLNLRLLEPCPPKVVDDVLAALCLVEAAGYPEELATIESTNVNPTPAALDTCLGKIGGIAPEHFAVAIYYDQNLVLVRTSIELTILMLFARYKGEGLIARLHQVDGKLMTYLGKTFDSNRYWPCFHYRAAREWIHGRSDQPIVHYGN